MADLEQVITEENFDTKNVVITDAKKQEKSLLRNIMWGAKMIAVSTFLATAPLSVDAQVVQSNAWAEITSVLQDGKEGESKEVTPPKEIDGIALTDEEKKIYINYWNVSLTSWFTPEELQLRATKTVQRKRRADNVATLQAQNVQAEKELEQKEAHLASLMKELQATDALVTLWDKISIQMQKDKLIFAVLQKGQAPEIAWVTESIAFRESIVVPELSGDATDMQKNVARSIEAIRSSTLHKLAPSKYPIIENKIVSTSK